MHNLDMKKLYETGLTIVEVATEVNCSRSKCYRTLCNLDTQFRRVGRRTRVNKDVVLKMREKGASYRQIAEKFGVSHVTIYNVLKKYLKGSPE